MTTQEFATAGAGPALAALLASVDPAPLTPEEQLAFIRGTERLAAWAQSRQNDGLVAFAGGEARTHQLQIDGHSIALVDERRSEIALECMWSEQAAHQRLTTARALASDLPATRAALESGRVSAARANAIVEGAAHLTSRIDDALDQPLAPETRAELRETRVRMLSALEERSVPYACTHAVSRVRQQVRRVVTAIDPEGAARRHAQARVKLTDVRIDHLPDAMSTITATMPSHQAVLCLRAIDAIAKDPSRFDPGLPIGVRRAHAMQTLLNGGLLGEAPTLHLDVTMDLTTLFGLNSDSATLDGVGPIPAAVVLELIGSGVDVTLRRLVTDPVKGVVTDVGRHTYAIGDRLRAFVAARDGTCRMPNCSRPAHLCDIDHITPFHDGGPTTPENTHLLCRRHHQCKTHARWDMQGAAEGMTITTAHGVTYSVRPEENAPMSAASGMADLHSMLDAVQIAREYRMPVPEGVAASLAARDAARHGVDDDIAFADVTVGIHRAHSEGILAAVVHTAFTRHHRRTCDALPPLCTHFMRRTHLVSRPSTTADQAETPPF